MNSRFIAPLLFGAVGAAMLIGLGVWQVQRLHWKQAILAEITARLGDAPVPLPASPDPVSDKYRAVTVAGRFVGPEIDVLTSMPERGAGYRVIAAFVTADGRSIMVDRGFIAEDRRDDPRRATVATVSGTLHWPNETDSFTPPPDVARRIWFARDVAAMATALGTEPVLIVARADTGDGIIPLPVDTEDIPNNHLQYAITWFCLAVVWLGMTVLLLWRIRRRPDQDEA